MNLVKYSDTPEAYLNMDFIESVTKQSYENYVCFVNQNTEPYYISKSAYDTILAYGKAKI